MASDGTRFDSTRPRMSASPMFPPPTKPTFLPFTPMALPHVRIARQPRQPRDPRAEHRRADAHHGGAFLDRDLEIGAHAHRQLGESVALRQLPERPEPGAG